MVEFIAPERAVDRVFIHCSASDNPKHDDVEVVRQWHLEKGWSDIGYHYFIGRDGEIQAGRDLERTPAAQRGHNKGTIAICLHGLTRFSKKQETSLRKLCYAIDDAYDSDVTFHGHCEVSNKTCPVIDYKTILNLTKDGEMQ